MAMSMKDGLAIVDRVTKKASVGHMHSSHVTAFLEEIEKAVDDEREACAEIAEEVSTGRDGSTRSVCELIAAHIRGRK